MSMLALEDVHTHYGKIEALHGVSVEVNRGNRVADRCQWRRQDDPADDGLRFAPGDLWPGHPRRARYHP